MPKKVDHEERRRRITDAVCRITLRGGLNAATFRTIAAEAGMSAPLVQHYFATTWSAVECALDIEAASHSELRTRGFDTRAGPSGRPRNATGYLRRQGSDLDTPTAKLIKI